jgi:WD40 repeat protein
VIQVPSHIDIDQTSGRIAVGFDQAHVLIAIAPTDSPPLEDSLFALTAEWHSRPISGVDTSDEHALLMTYSCEESQIHVRNLHSNSLLLRHRVTGGSLLSACLHPSGSLVAVGLSTCLRIFHFLDFERKLSLWVQLPLTSCISMRFSHRGHLLAATDGRFVSIIDIATMSRSTYFRPPGMSSSADNAGGADAGNAVSSSALSFIRQLQWSEDDLCALFKSFLCITNILTGSFFEFFFFFFFFFFYAAGHY